MPGTFSNILLFVNLGIWENHASDNFRKDGHQEMIKARAKQSPKAWICISYLSKNMKWKFGKM